MTKAIIQKEDIVAIINLLGSLGLGAIGSLLGGMVANKVVKPVVEVKDYTPALEELREQAHEIHKDGVAKMADIGFAVDTVGAKVEKIEKCMPELLKIAGEVKASASSSVVGNSENATRLETAISELAAIKQQESATAQQIDNLTKKIDGLVKSQSDASTALIDGLEKIDWFIKTVTNQEIPVESDPFSQEEVHEEAIQPTKTTPTKRRAGKKQQEEN